jgi:peroxiredoxin
MLEVGALMPDVTLFDMDVRPVRLRDLAIEGALLLAFYLYDWTST